MAIGDQMMKSIVVVFALLLVGITFGVPCHRSIAQVPSAQKPTPANDGSTGTAKAADPNNPTSKEPRFLALEKMLSDVVLVGLFTVDGKKMSDLSEERYEIKSIQKLSNDDDLWALEVRIKYGKHDFTGPIVMSIKWADQTPVMTMDRILIPGLGTFSTRVVFHDGKYAGTWTHDEHGGHLFGRIEQNTSKKDDTK